LLGDFKIPSEYLLFLFVIIQPCVKFKIFAICEWNGKIHKRSDYRWNFKINKIFICKFL